MLEFRAHSSFLLVNRSARGSRERERETYICSIDPFQQTERRAAPTRLNLDPRQVMNVSLDLTAFLWQRAILSSPPSEFLYAAVPPGEYDLYFELRVRSGGVLLPGEATETPLYKQIKSNEVAVSLR